MPISFTKRSKRKGTSRLGKGVEGRDKGKYGTPAKSTSRSGGYARGKAQPSVVSEFGKVSPARKVDIVGVVMVVIGLLTLLGLFTSTPGSLSGSWVSGLRSIFGWGVYILPLGLMLIGAWVVARHVERLPALNIERLLGILFLFIGLLVAFHGLEGSTETAITRAHAGSGGGYIGALLQQGLVGALGSAGAVVFIIAWLIVAAAMTLDLSLQEMFAWAGPLIARARNSLNRPADKPVVRLGTSEPAQNISASQVQASPLRPMGRPGIQPTHRPAPGVTVRTGLASSPAIQWTLPRVNDILEPPQAPSVNQEFVEKRARLIEETLASFGAPAQVVEISRGPTVTMFGVEPLFIESRTGQTRVRVSKIAALADDLALALSAPRIRIQAPVPGHGYVGIEVPNEEMSLVALRDVLESEIFARSKSPLRFALGKDVAGHPKAANLDSMPHLLIAGTTGSGKSVCVNSILTCLLINNTPDDMRLILVDPKRVELTGYNGIPHLLAPVVVETERVIGALQWMTREMDTRYHKFASVGARNIQDYNLRVEATGGKKIPYLLVVIDELADLMMISPDETERTITRLSQLSRATGIHMVLATQRPSTDVVTGLIKANFPARIAFAVASNTDSRVILDQPGAERLLGRGDMLFQAPDAPSPVRLQGVFVSDMETNRLVEFWKNQAGTSPQMPAGSGGQPSEGIAQGTPLKQVPMFEDITAPKGDMMLDEAIDIVRREGRASVSMLQRKLRVGYTRAARLVDVMEEKGIVGPPAPGTGVREVLDYGPAAPPKED